MGTKSETSLIITLAQLNLVVGDVQGNTERIADIIHELREDGSTDLVVFQELALCGYPPEDLLFHSGMQHRVADALQNLCAETQGIAVLIGYPEYADGLIYNSAAWIQDGRIRGIYRKRCLPNYGVFDEQRYFTAGSEALVLELSGINLGVTICEDIWDSADAARVAVEEGADLIVSINGSPFDFTKQNSRESLLAERACELNVPLVYQNMVGGQDELVFDGGSCVVNAQGEICVRAPAFVEGLYRAEFHQAVSANLVTPMFGEVAELPNEEQSIYAAIVMGVRDYVRKNGFEGIVLGLSGGIDSALCLTIAVDALGADAVQAVMMQYHYTSTMSYEDAATQADLLGVAYTELPIAPMVDASNATLAEMFAGMPEDSTEENIQARCRGILLMAISNKTHRIVLTTGNKSEMAIGYATLYGDMAGGFAPIKDCTKTLVYRLARYRNTLSAAIPERVIEREPSAELRPDQKDSDSLPPYDVLDPILDALIIEDLSVDEIAALGFDHEVVGRTLDMVRRNEYKRRQSPPGVRISGRAFGRDWRYPMTSGYGRSR
ncbi:MAG: NAD+ synthase [Gammaproteobacteria bacterium]|nr:NAD+ synthase [Gammaproteobacteria bacterium]MCP4088629.1 NAD+ synthase [Gammaproteobacteria bacterium]MCP4276463.1 NAD+ synthase [Gammaproteobacteria bacterium]MCP4832340.1 NAD+ synthase [Gammaproteobacteria bacterium]MCP4929146.1 NAD+ synthase [Gammaproteobacteria bacterium]